MNVQVRFSALIVCLAVALPNTGCGRQKQNAPKQEVASPEQVRPTPSSESSAAEAKELFSAARDVLSQYKSSADKPARANVQAGVELLKRYLAHPGSAEDSTALAEATRILRNAEDVLRGDRTLLFLLGLDDEQLGAIESERRTKVPLASLDQFSIGFGAINGATSGSSFFRMVERIGNHGATDGEAKLSCDRRGRYATMIEVVFFDSIYENLPKALEERRKILDEQRSKRIAAREKSPQLTAPLFRVSESVESFDGKCLFFDNVWVSGDISPRDDGFYTVPVRDDREARYDGFGDKLVFVCPKTMADKLRDVLQANTRGKARIYCDIYHVRPKTGTTLYVNGREVPQSRARAEIYQVAFYSEAGTIHSVLEE